MRAATRPLIVPDPQALDGACIALERIDLVKTGAYDESWIQALVDRFPALLPIEELEPGLSGAIPVCRELGVPSGFIDNLLIGRDGGLVIVEAKLWRNPQSRREVVGQVLDYAKDLAAWTYSDLETAVQRARKQQRSLFEIVSGPNADDADEGLFVDRVSRNLRLGRFLCFIVGDGIAESAEKLADFLQRHVGLHFTLAMVEFSIWRLPNDQGVLVQPRVITRTVEIERAVVRLDAQGAPSAVGQPTEIRRTVSITQEQFDEQLAQLGAALPAQLSAFIESLEPLGVTATVKKAMNFKRRCEDGSQLELFFIMPNGEVWFDRSHWYADARGRIDLSHAFMSDLAGAISGAHVRQTAKPTGWNVRKAAGPVTVTDLLVSAEGVRTAIARYVTAFDALAEVG